MRPCYQKSQFTQFPDRKVLVLVKEALKAPFSSSKATSKPFIGVEAIPVNYCSRLLVCFSFFVEKSIIHRLCPTGQLDVSVLNNSSTLSLFY